MPIPVHAAVHRLHMPCQLRLTIVSSRSMFTSDQSAHTVMTQLCTVSRNVRKVLAVASRVCPQSASKKAAEDTPGSHQRQWHHHRLQ